jgi:RNase adaptor protein for sRNA GlmZ degradation
MNYDAGSPVTVISFGYLHGPAPAEAHAAIDVRHHFRDPHVSPALRNLTAADEPVVSAVLSTPGIAALSGSLAAMARAFRAGPCPAPLVIAVGCAGGRHRSAVIAAEVTRQLRAEGAPVTLSHRDIHRPVVLREAS